MKKMASKKKSGLNKRLQKVLDTPASFAFFIAIHDFVKHIELDISLSKGVVRDTKYAYLKQIYQGIEDVGARSSADLGHERYMVINDLNRIEKKEVSDSNSFWKKRELFRKLAVEIYERLEPQSVQPKK